MVRHRLNIARMVYRVEFGHEVDSDKINPNTGQNIKEFKPAFWGYAAKWTLTQYQQITLAGAGIKNAMVFAVRHDERITSDYLLRLNGKLFSIDHILYDEGRTVDAYDLIACHHLVTEHG